MPDAPRKPTSWALLVAAIAFLSAAFSFIANAGHARDTVCSLPILVQPCINYGLIDVRAAGRIALLQKVVGTWGNPTTAGAPACATRLIYAVSQEGDEDFIEVRAQGWASVGRVASAEGTSIFTRTVSPVSQAGTQWELRLEEDRLIQIDSAGVPTPLVRCAN